MIQKLSLALCPDFSPSRSHQSSPRGCELFLENEEFVSHRVWIPAVIPAQRFGLSFIADILEEGSRQRWFLSLRPQRHKVGILPSNSVISPSKHSVAYAFQKLVQPVARRLIQFALQLKKLTQFIEIRLVRCLHA